MAAYARFWDAHLVTPEGAYDFTDDIASYAAYQRLGKVKNAIGKPAYVVLTRPILSWQKVVAQLLKNLPGVEVKLQISRQRLLDHGVEIFKKLLTSGATSLSVHVLDDKMLAKVLPNRAPVTVVASELVDNRVLKVKKIADSEFYAFYYSGSGLTRDAVLVAVEGPDENEIAKLLLPRLPEVGYVASTVALDEVDGVKNPGTSPVTRALVEWANGAGRGKIRTTVHGDGEGHIYMGETKMAPAQIAHWLHRNGLTSKRELETLSLALCHASMYKTAPAFLDDHGEQSVPAEQSAIHDVAKTLGSLGVKGVKVTGSNEVVWTVLPPESWTVETLSGQALRPGQGVRFIEIPQKWPFEKTTRTLTLPSGWTVAKNTTTKRFVLTPAEEGKVEKFKTSGWVFTLKSGVQHIFPDGGWMVDPTKKCVTMAEGWVDAGVSKLVFQGNGGDLSLRSLGGDEEAVLTIMERLAHSKAKAALVS